MKNAFTIDLEDWFCSHNLKSVINYCDWDKLESRVERNTYLLLNFLDANKVKSTFFVLGWIAERYPDLVKVINQEGHEIASHGYAHQQITCQTMIEFEKDINLSKSILSEITGKCVKGYRAPAFSITNQTQWALPILKNKGFLYDSSIYPFSLHPDYGDKNTPLEIHFNKGLTEVPLSCISIGKFRVPCSGGAYLRFYPLPFFLYLARKVQQQNRSFIFYIHPWEIDNKSPKIDLKFSKSLRHYFNTGSTLPKIERLVKEFEFTSIQNLLSL